MDDGFTRSEDMNDQHPRLSSVDFDNSFTWFEGGDGDADDSFQANSTEPAEQQEKKEAVAEVDEESDRRAMRAHKQKNSKYVFTIMMFFFIYLTYRLSKTQPAPVPYSVYTFLAEWWAKIGCMAFFIILIIQDFSLIIACAYDKLSSYKRMQAKVERLNLVFAKVTIRFVVYGACFMDLAALGTYKLFDHFQVQTRQTGITSWEVFFAVVHRIAMIAFSIVFIKTKMEKRKAKSSSLEKYEATYDSLRKGSVADLKADEETPFTKTACDKSAEEFEDETMVCVLPCGHVIKDAVMKEELKEQEADEELEDPECPVCQVTIRI